MNQEKSKTCKLVKIVLLVIAILVILIIIFFFTAPSFAKARKRAIASTVLNEARQLDSALDSYALENNKTTSVTAAFTDLTPYLKAGSRLWSNQGKDSLDHPFIFGHVGQGIFVSDESVSELTSIQEGGGFWEEYHPICMAAARDDREMVLKHLNEPGVLGACGGFALNHAAENGRLDLVRLLLDKGVSANAQRPAGKSRRVVTSLSVAAGNGHIGVVKLLLERGADANKQDEYGHTPLSYALRAGHADVVEALKEAGAKE